MNEDHWILPDDKNYADYDLVPKWADDLTYGDGQHSYYEDMAIAAGDSQHPALSRLTELGVIVAKQMRLDRAGPEFPYDNLVFDQLSTALHGQMGHRRYHVWRKRKAVRQPRRNWSSFLPPMDLGYRSVSSYSRWRNISPSRKDRH